MNNGTKMNLVELATELERQKNTKKDYVFSSDDMIVVIDKKTDTIKMDIPIPDHAKAGHRESYPLTDICHQHIAEKTPIGTRYYKRMKDEGYLDLLKDNIMAWLPTKEKRMVRLLDTEGDGVVRMRALLSDSYRIIDNHDVLNNAMDIIRNRLDKNLEIYFKDVVLSDTRLYIKALSKKLTDEIHTLKGRDIIEGGIVIMNSEVGYGKYKCIPFLNVLKCKNGLIGEEAFTKVHLGMKRGEGLINWSDDTLQKNDALLWAKITDVIINTFNPDIMQKWVDKINKVSTIELTEPTIALNNVVKSYNIPKGKVDELLMHFGQEEPTLWGISNAVTRLAQHEKNYDNQIEYEEVGRKILELNPQTIC